MTGGCKPIVGENKQWLEKINKRGGHPFWGDRHFVSIVLPQYGTQLGFQSCQDILHIFVGHPIGPAQWGPRGDYTARRK